MSREIRDILQSVKEGSLSVEEAFLKLKTQPFEDIGYAKVDLHRRVRQGAAEVIYGAGKTPEQIAGIAAAMKVGGEERILITRLSKEAAALLGEQMELTYHEEAGIGIIGTMPEPDGIGRIVVATGGTSDIPVAEEAALTAEIHGNEVVRLYDVGVAGLHRLLSHIEDIMSASVIIAVAGMEGALASVIGGLADCPVIAVPTSVGYGAAFGGVSALLSMLNSCASGVSVVNIDNGFGAGYLAGMMNHMTDRNHMSDRKYMTGTKHVTDTKQGENI
ncbi:MAG: nickel pincer cofactor biosynthesis protein LarB [Acetatifactor sp.]